MNSLEWFERKEKSSKNGEGGLVAMAGVGLG